MFSSHLLRTQIILDLEFGDIPYIYVTEIKEMIQYIISAYFIVMKCQNV